MTAPDESPPPGARWRADLAATLAAASVRIRRLAAGIADDWLDEHGREWAERTSLLHRELDRLADAAAALGAELAPSPADHPAPDPTAALRAGVLGASAARRPGARLGATTGTYACDEPGMRIAEFAPP